MENLTIRTHLSKNINGRQLITRIRYNIKNSKVFYICVEQLNMHILAIECLSHNCLYLNSYIFKETNTIQISFSEVFSTCLHE